MKFYCDFETARHTGNRKPPFNPMPVPVQPVTSVPLDLEGVGNDLLLV